VPRHSDKLNAEKAVAVWYDVTVYQINHGGMAYTKACTELAAQEDSSREHLIDLYLYGKELPKPLDFPYYQPPRKRMISDRDWRRGEFEFWSLGEWMTVSAKWLELQVKYAKINKGMSDPKYLKKGERAVKAKVKRWFEKWDA